MSTSYSCPSIVVQPNRSSDQSPAGTSQRSRPCASTLSASDTTSTNVGLASLRACTSCQLPDKLAAGSADAAGGFAASGDAAWRAASKATSQNRIGSGRCSTQSTRCGPRTSAAVQISFFGASSPTSQGPFNAPAQLLRLTLISRPSRSASSTAESEHLPPLVAHELHFRRRRRHMVFVIAAGVEQQQTGEALPLHLLQVPPDRGLGHVALQPPPVGPGLVRVRRLAELFFKGGARDIGRARR